ncbi:MAG: hypothetical protein JXA90_11755, partial [Planctomycetes bacterium]|nr:hypothetical protein [Planctomycetota bacterium]
AGSPVPEATDSLVEDVKVVEVGELPGDAPLNLEDVEAMPLPPEPAQGDAAQPAPDDEMTMVLQGSPSRQVTIEFDYLYLLASELSRIVLTFESLYNEVLKSLRGYSEDAMIFPEERLRVAQAIVGRGAVLTFRGAAVISQTDIEADAAEDLDALQIVKNILLLLPNLSRKKSSKLQVVGAPAGADSGDGDASRALASGTADPMDPADLDGAALETLEREVARWLPGASSPSVARIVDVALSFPREIFSRRNLWGLECK